MNPMPWIRERIRHGWRGSHRLRPVIVVGIVLGLGWVVETVVSQTTQAPPVLTPQQQAALFEIRFPAVAQTARNWQRSPAQAQRDLETFAGFLNPQAEQEKIMRRLSVEKAQVEASAAETILNPRAARQRLERQQTSEQAEREAAAIRAILLQSSQSQ